MLLAKMRNISTLVLLLLAILMLPAIPFGSAQTTNNTLVIGVVASPITGNFNYYAGGEGGAGFPAGMVNIGTGYWEPGDTTWYPLFANVTVGPLVNMTFAQIGQYMHYVNYTGPNAFGPVLNQSFTYYKWMNFTLVPGIKFSDGEPLTAQDIVLEMDLNEAPGASNMPPGTNVGTIQSNWTPGVSINWATSNAFWWYAPNNYTVSIVLASSLSNVRLMWSNPPMPWSIFHTFKNETALKAFKWTNPIGLGPWVLQSWTTSSETFAPNPYWVTPVPQVKGKIAGEYAYGPIQLQHTTPSVKTMVIDVFTSPSSAELALKSGAIQAVQINIPNIQTVWDPSISPTENVWWYNQTSTVYLGLNDAMYPFNLTQFRQAIAYAINRTYIAKVGEVGYGVAAPPVGMSLGMYDSYLTPQTRASLNPYNTNITAAKALLKSAGFTWNSNGQLVFPNGTVVPAFTLMVPSNAPDWETDAIIISDELEPLGLSITVQPLTPSLLSHYESTGYFQMMIITGGGFTPWSAWQFVMNPQFMVGYGGGAAIPYPWNSSVKPDTPLHFGMSGDFVRYFNVEMGNMFYRDNAVISPAQRVADFNTMAQIIDQQLPLIPLFDPIYAYEYNSAQWTGWHTVYNVYGMTPGDSDFYGFEALFLKPVVPTYSVSIATAPSGGSVAINGTSYSSGQTATLQAGTYTITAQPPSGMTFSGYASTGSVSVVSPTSSSTSITVTGAGGITVAWKSAPVYASAISAPTLSSTSVTTGSPVTVTVTATLSNGSAAAGQLINFYANGALVGSALTGSNGAATFTYTPSSPGTYTISASLAPKPSVTSSSTASLSASSPTNYGLYGAIVVIIILIAVVAFLALRTSKKPQK